MLVDFFLVLQHFHEVAYQADDRQDLLTAINHFLDCSVVLPPSEVGGDELLHSVARFQREMLRKREEQQSGKLQEKQTDNQQDEGHPSFDLDHFGLYLIVTLGLTGNDETGNSLVQKTSIKI